MEMKVKVVMSDNKAYALPRCENSLRICRIANREFLTTEDLKTLELMGFKIVIEEEPSNI